MKHPTILSCILLLWLLLPRPATGAAFAELRQLERTALENNLQLRAATYTTRESEEAVRKGYGIYDPQASAVIEEAGRNDLTNQPFFSAETESASRRFDFSLVQKLPSGAELTLSFENGRRHTDPEPFINPSYDSSLSFSLVQPLLKGFGRTITEQEIFLAAHDHEAAVEDLREQVFDILAAVRNAYFEVLRFRDELAFRDSSHALAEKVLEETRAKVDAGVFPPIEMLEAEVGLTLREQERLDTGRAYQDALDALTLLLGPNEKISVAAETLIRPQLVTDEEKGYRLALSRRPDLLRRLREIERISLEKKLARNAMLPELDLSGSYSRMGLGEKYGDSLADWTEEDFHNWQIGLTLSYPLGNREARHAYQQTRNRLKSRQASLEQLREETRKEVRSAMRLIEVSDKKVDVTGKGRALAEKKLNNLLKRHQVGLATTRDVLEGEEDLARARTDQISSLVDYNNALTEYLRVTGQLLEHEGVRLAPESGLDEEICLIR